MALTVRQFLLAKAGNSPEHNDDSIAVDLVNRRFALADGATEGGFSRLWSKLLVDEFVSRANVPPDDWSRWLPAAQAQWLEKLKSMELPWYGQEQFVRGSFATFLGLVLLDAEAAIPLWQAVAVGDSCLFHTRGEQLLASFPLEKSIQFNNTPKLVGSRSPIAEVAGQRATSLQGTSQAGDRFWLISDALAQWCLAQVEAGRPPWLEMAAFLSHNFTDEQFFAWVGSLRNERGLHNDDVALLAIEL
jgi:hypothetical protein